MVKSSRVSFNFFSADLHFIHLLLNVSVAHIQINARNRSVVF